jgi:hypothetical protein
MKIIPYSVLAATLVGGAVATPGSGALASPAADGSEVAQGETKSKLGTEAGAPGQVLSGLPAGTIIYTELAKSVDATRAKPGDEIVARTTLAVLWQGKIAIPNDSKIFGHVTEAVALPGGDGQSRLGILFDRVLLKDGTKAPIALTVQAIGRQTVTPHAGDDDEEGDSETRPPRLRTTNPSGRPSTNQMPTDSVTPGPPAAELAKSKPTLDAGSQGVIGMPDLNLIESKDAGRGALIESTKRNVKLDNATELVLRVIAEPAEGMNKPQE